MEKQVIGLYLFLIIDPNCLGVVLLCRASIWHAFTSSG